MVYNVVWMALVCCGWPFLLMVLLISAKRRKTVLKRLWLPGLAPRAFTAAPARQNEKPYWMHALSVGEVLSAIPLVKRLKKAKPRTPIVFSVSTLTGFEVAKRFVRDHVDHLVYYPYDFLYAVKTAFNRIDTACLIIVESDVWPNVVFEATSRQIPIYFVNARLSDRSFKRYQQFSFLSQPLFSRFNAICVQSRADAARFQQLGVPCDHLRITGNIKFDQDPADIKPAERQTIERRLNLTGARPIFIAGSTHEPEEAILLDALNTIKNECPDVFMIIAPRNPERSPAIQALCRQKGFRAVCWHQAAQQPSLKHHDTPAADVIIIDGIGLLRTLYAAADIALIGGSLIPRGGHNPLEAAVFAKPVLLGPHMSNFRAISYSLLEGGGALTVSNADDIAQAAVRLLKDKPAAQHMGRQAFQVFKDHQGAVDKTLKIVMQTAAARNSKSTFE
jgi:3-deoxy-D-manno-octulosonic-acid transferase